MEALALRPGLMADTRVLGIRKFLRVLLFVGSSGGLILTAAIWLGHLALT
jgi:hypothetical protein